MLSVGRAGSSRTPHGRVTLRRSPAGPLAPPPWAEGAQRTVGVGGATELSVRAVGRHHGDQTPFVFLHGLGGTQVYWTAAEGESRRGDIVAVGPRFADGIATGYVFPTTLEDQARCIISEDLAPAGYAYLLVWEGRGTVATCLFRDQQNWQEAHRQTVEAFTRLVPGPDLGEARPFSGYGSVFGASRYRNEAERLFVGEAAGLQDPEWGFGMWYAVDSGALAARSLIEGFSYDEAAGDRFDRRRLAALFNRLLYERLPAFVVPSLLRRVPHLRICGDAFDATGHRASSSPESPAPRCPGSPAPGSPTGTRPVTPRRATVCGAPASIR